MIISILHINKNLKKVLVYSAFLKYFFDAKGYRNKFINKQQFPPEFRQQVFKISLRMLPVD